MSVIAPPRPPSPAVADSLEALREEALIKEARQRARRRRQRYAALVAMATVIAGLVAVFALRPDTGGAQPSATSRPLAPAATSATRSTIVFTTNPSGTSMLYRMNADGTGLHRLFSWQTLWQRVGHWGSWPALSPDGRHIAFQAGTPRRPGIDVANLDGTGVHWVNGGMHPTWSPDGTHIAYSTWSQEIYTERPDGTDWRLVTLRGLFPSWSPDGTKLAYVCRPRNASLCVMNADGTGQHQIAAAASYATPAWSPDGTRIAFVGRKLNFVPGVALPDGRHVSHVYVINANGTNLRRLPPRVSYKSTDCSPAWSPNGKQIAFSPNTFGRIGGIYLMNADGRNVVHIKGTTSFTCGISWRRTPA